MQIRIHDPAQIGEIVRATRKAEHMRQDVTASAIGVSENFLGKVERGNSSVYWHKLFHVLSELGIHVYLDVPPSTETMLLNAAQDKKRSEAQAFNGLQAELAQAFWAPESPSLPLTASEVIARNRG